MAGGSVSITIAGQEYRLKSEGEADAERLRQVAVEVDETMARLGERTGTVDTRDLAILTALNLARELVRLRGAPADSSPGASATREGARLRELADLAEVALAQAESA